MDLKESYQLLGVKRTDTIETIHSQYRKLAMKYHPDHNEGNPEADKIMKQLSEAWENIEKWHTTFSAAPELQTETHNLDEEEIDAVCRLLNMSRTQLAIEYIDYRCKTFYTSEHDITFIEWLKNKVIISPLCEQLGKSEKELREEYEIYTKNTLPAGETHKTFIEWLDDKIMLFPFCTKLNEGEEQLHTKYSQYKNSIYYSDGEYIEKVIIRDLLENDYRISEKPITSSYGFQEEYILYAGNPDMSFQEWLEFKIKIKELFEQLNQNKLELMDEYYSYRRKDPFSDLYFQDKHDKSFLEWLEQKAEIKKLCEQISKDVQSVLKEYYAYTSAILRDSKMFRISFIEWLRNKAQMNKEGEVQLK